MTEYERQAIVAALKRAFPNYWEAIARDMYWDELMGCLTFWRQTPMKPCMYGVETDGYIHT